MGGHTDISKPAKRAALCEDIDRVNKVVPNTTLAPIPKESICMVESSGKREVPSRYKDAAKSLFGVPKLARYMLHDPAAPGRSLRSCSLKKQLWTIAKEIRGMTQDKRERKTEPGTRRSYTMDSPISLFKANDVCAIPYTRTDRKSFGYCFLDTLQ